MQSGTIKYFNDAKRYGFILPDDGSDSIFFHENAVVDAGELARGVRVQSGPDKRDRNKTAAVRVELE